MALLLPLLLRGLPYLIAAAIAAFVWWKADHYCNSACRDQRARADAAESAIKVAQQRATDLALLWAKQTEATDEAARQARKANDQVFAGLANDVRRLPAGGHLAISPAARRVFDSITAAANAEPAPDPAPVEPATAAVSCIPERDAADAWNKAAEAYRDAVTLLQQTRDWYDSLRSH